MCELCVCYTALPGLRLRRVVNQSLSTCRDKRASHHTPPSSAGPPAPPALALPGHLHWWLREIKGAGGLWCEGRDSHRVGRRGSGALQEESPAFVGDSGISRSPRVGEDTRLEGTFLPQLILLTGQQPGKGARLPLAGLWAPSPMVSAFLLSESLPTPTPQESSCLPDLGAPPRQALLST